MNKMSRRKVLDTIFTVVFIGIILSFTLVFLSISLFPKYALLSEKYFDGSELSGRGIFAPFDDACLKNESFYELINKYEYKIFGNISSGEVLVGENGFLFDAGVNEHGYDYAEDYTGGVVLSEDDLERIYTHLQIRGQAYENFGATYVLAVIPNSQTVYSENMPSYMGEISDNTMLSQISTYLMAHGFDGFVDLTDVMIEGKSYGQLYNNTENTINALGAYVAYSGIVDHIEYVSGKNVNALPSDYFVLQTRVTDGKGLAESVALSELIKNNTIYISNANEKSYTLLELFGGLETTYVKYGYGNDSSGMDVFIECTQEWDKVQLMPYFSSTFHKSSYRSTHTYSRPAIASSLPDVVVQVIREDELRSILDSAIASSYDEGLEHGQHPYKTLPATNIGCVRIADNKYLVTGVVEQRANVTFFGDGIVPSSVSVVDGRFLAVVEIHDPSVATEICINAQAGEKAISEMSYVLVGEGDRISYGSPIFISRNGMLYKNSYYVRPLPTDSVIKSYTQKIESYFEDIELRSYGAQPKKVFAFIPSKISVYNEGLSELLQMESNDLAAMRNVIGGVLKNSSVVVADTVGALLTESASSKLYSQSGDQLADLGSYYIYCEIIRSLGIPAIVPNTLDDPSYTVVRGVGNAGEHAKKLGFTDKTFSETSIEINVNGEFEYQNGSDDFSSAFTTVHKNKNLPRAIIVRDSNGEANKIIELLADNFSVLYVLAEGSSEIPEDLISDGVDYIIFLTSEGEINIQ